MLLEFDIPSGKFDFLFIFLLNAHVMTLKMSCIKLYFTKEPIWNNIFQQTFDPNTHAENVLKLLLARVRPIFMLPT